MSGEVFYGRSVRRSEGSRTAKGIVGRRTDESFYFFLEPPHKNEHESIDNRLQNVFFGPL